MKVQTKQIGSYSYQVTQVTSSVGLEAAARMANLIGPGLLAAPETGGFDGATLGAVLGGILANPALSGQLAWFVKAFGDLTQVQLGPNQSKTLTDIYETHFQGEIEDQLIWLAFAFEVNMGSFFARVKANVVKALALLQKVNLDSRSPTSVETSGQSGE